jgi:hypothetical protein
MSEISKYQTNTDLMYANVPMMSDV